MQKINPRLLNWASILDEQTQAQAERVASLPFIHKHVALMPDAHWGKGATVGSVIATDRTIIPAAVGVDIGCGMRAVRTQFTAEQFRSHSRGLPELREAIEAAIPASAGGYNDELSESARRRTEDLFRMAGQAGFDPREYAENWRLQLGSLGGGNHFLEICADEEDRIWLFLHSGSRGVGNKIATKHIRIARQLCEQWWIELPDPDLAYLVEGAPEFWPYIREMTWAQEFARENRAEMMDRMLLRVGAWLDARPQILDEIDCHHNYTTQEDHFGKTVWLSRKGAINAAAGVRGLIPGSMGAASYIVTGKGNVAAFHSSPHGAGRQHSRKQAATLFTQADLRAAMAGIEFRDTDAFLDEHPGAYKPIGQVMADADDLVEVKHTLSQLVNVKGD